jgi:TolB protein
VLLSPDGRRLRDFRVASVNGDAPPAWSRSGRELAFETMYDNQRTGSTDARLTVLSVATGARRTLADFAVDTPSWSPRDRSLVYLTGDLVIDTKPVKQQIWTVSADGGRLRRIARGATDDFPPQLSRDGRRLLFARDYSVWIARADGSRQTRLASGLDLPAAAWAPNDRDVAAVTSGETRSRAFLLSPAGKRRALLPQTIASEPVAWSPDGRLIAWVDEHSGATLIHVVRPDGSGHRVLARMADRVVVFGLSWSPDSRRLAFSASKSNED